MSGFSAGLPAFRRCGREGTKSLRPILINPEGGWVVWPITVRTTGQKLQPGPSGQSRYEVVRYHRLGRGDFSFCTISIKADRLEYNQLRQKRLRLEATRYADSVIAFTKTSESRFPWNKKGI